MGMTLYEATRAADRFRDQTVVVKLGGALLVRQDWVAAIAQDVATLMRLGVRVVLVHGGGPQLDGAAAHAELPNTKVGGRRITTPEHLDLAIVEWVGRLATSLVLSLQRAGAPAVPFPAFATHCVQATRRPVTKNEHGAPLDYGEVGDIVATDVSAMSAILPHAVPVVSSLASDGQGGLLNVNADTIAAELSVAMGAAAFILLTQTPGILADRERPESVLERTDLAECDRLREDGVLVGGMLPKFAAIRRALEAGVPAAHIVDGRIPHVLLEELLTHEGHGTLVVA